MNFLLALFIYSMILFTWGDHYTALSDMTMGMKFNEHAQEIGFCDGDILTEEEFPQIRAQVQGSIDLDRHEAESVPAVGSAPGSGGRCPLSVTVPEPGAQPLVKGMP